MVTTISFGQDLDFRTVDLLDSDLQADRDLANTAISTLEKLVSALLPMITYVDELFGGTGGIRGVLAAADGPRVLILDRKGQWYIFRDSTFSVNPDAWQLFPFSDVIHGLTHAFEQASIKKREHLAAVEKRLELLKKIEAVIRGEEASK